MESILRQRGHHLRSGFRRNWNVLDAVLFVDHQAVIAETAEILLHSRMLCVKYSLKGKQL